MGGRGGGPGCEIKDKSMPVHVSGDVGTWVEEDLDTNTEDVSGIPVLLLIAILARNLCNHVLSQLYKFGLDGMNI